MNSTDEGVTSDSGLRMGHASITPARLKWDRQPPRSIAHPQPCALAAVACKDGLEQRATLRHLAGSLRSG